MSRSALYSDLPAAESQDALNSIPGPRRFMCLLDYVAPLKISFQRLYANSISFVLTFLALAYNPKSSTYLLIDCLSLIRSTWSGRQLGPDLVYPMLRIKKRQSWRLATLILEHSRGQPLSEPRARTTFLHDINPANSPSVCVAFMDIDRPSKVAANNYSTHGHFQGLMCMLIVVETIITLVLHLSILWDMGWITWVNLCFGGCFNVILCCLAVVYGDGTLRLARRSDTPTGTPTMECAVLLEEDFTLVLNGDRSVVEAIAEGSFYLSYESRIWTSTPTEHTDQDVFYGSLTDLCEGICLALLVFCWLLSRPSTLQAKVAPILIFATIAVLPQVLQPTPSNHSPHLLRLRIGKALFRLIPLIPICLQVFMLLPISVLAAHFGLLFVALFFINIFAVGRKARNYPIRLEKFLDALGHPPIRKWEFDTPAAAATFQCLILCHTIARPACRKMNVLAFLDVLIPDEAEVWTAWKARVADRIVHETDISFTPTVATFRDQRQQELVKLLNQAQFGFDKYRELYGQNIPATPETTDRAKDSPTLFARIWSEIRRHCHLSWAAIS